MTTETGTPPTRDREAEHSDGKSDAFKTMEMAELYKKLDTSDDGLSKGEAAKRLTQYGPNEIAEHKTNPLLKFLSYFWGPIPWMIEIAVILSGVVGHWPDFFIILVLLVANAGVNLAKLEPKDVTVHGQSISLHLPPAEVFSTRIDHGRTRVYSRDTGLFSSPDPNLETLVLQEAERQLQQAALQDGILKLADQNARNTVSSLLKGFGFSEVNIQ